MNKIPSLFLRNALLAAGFLLLCPPWAAALEYRTNPRESSLVEIDGTSTMHDWNARGEVLEGFVRWQGAIPVTGNPAPAEPLAMEGKLSIPGLSLRSFRRGRPYSPRMDAIMHEKLMAEDHPHITFEPEVIRLTKLPETATDPFLLQAKGKLSVAGVEKKVEFPLEMWRRGESELKMKAAIDLKMSDFKIEPPVALGGAIRTGDEVKVSVEWMLSVYEKKEKAVPVPSPQTDQLSGP